jgi:membrane associated rhomboid family serine protease
VTVRRIPVLTAAAVAVAAVAAVVQYAVPAVVPVLERGPLDTGEWWRLVTPLLVQTLGWYQVVTNLVTLALVGAVAEPLLGRWRWVVLFVAGTVAGQVAAYAWHEPGGGDSIAICGLAGGVVAWLWAHPTRSGWTAEVVVGYVAALTGWGFGGVKAAAVAVVVAAIVLRVVPSQRVALAGAIACAVVLTAASDLHGVSLVSGMVVGAVLTVLAARQPVHGVR